MQEVTLHFLVDAIVIYVLNDMKVKRTLTRWKFFLPCKKSRFTFFDNTGYVSFLYETARR